MSFRLDGYPQVYKTKPTNILCGYTFRSQDFIWKCAHEAFFYNKKCTSKTFFYFQRNKNLLCALCPLSIGNVYPKISDEK